MSPLGKDPQWERKLTEANTRIQQLSRDIVDVRQREHDGWILELFTRGKNEPDITKPGCGLDLSRVELIIERIPSSVDGVPSYERVDMPQTFMNHPDQEALLNNLPDGYARDWQGVLIWADHLGNIKYQKRVPEFEGANIGYHTAKAAWVDMYVKASNRLGGLSPSCRAA
ncbi:hypothetical protein ACHAPI_009868 [Fusarium lateritium]